jgi:hypothetical protein
MLKKLLLSGAAVAALSTGAFANTAEDKVFDPKIDGGVYVDVGLGTMTAGGGDSLDTYVVKIGITEKDETFLSKYNIESKFNFLEFHVAENDLLYYPNFEIGYKITDSLTVGANIGYGFLDTQDENVEALTGVMTGVSANYKIDNDWFVNAKMSSGELDTSEGDFKADIDLTAISVGYVF